MSFFNKMNKVLTPEDRKYLMFLLAFTLVIAIMETVGISIVMPFFSLANDLSQIKSNPYSSYIYDYLSFNSEKGFVITFGLVILLFYIVRLLLNSLYVYLTMKFIYSRYEIITSRLFKTYLRLPYGDLIKHNKSSLVKVIVNEAANITEIYWFSLILLSELLVFFLVYSILMYVNYQITLAISLIIATVSVIVKLYISRNIKSSGIKREKYQKIFYEVLNKNFNNIKMIKLESRDEYLSEFKFASDKYSHAKTLNGTLQQLPRYVFEYVGYSLVVMLIIYILSMEVTNALPMVSVFILGLYRLLPSVTRIFLSYNTILFQYKSLDIISHDLNLKVESCGNDELKFDNNIELRNISFKYNDRLSLLDDFSLEICKNDSIAFIGPSGSGKSTLVDIIMGLHKINKGKILIDGRELTDCNLQSWRDYFGYIPQDVYLFEGNVAQNVAFSSSYDSEKVIDVLRKANIWNFLKDKEGLETIVGEGGVMLSGGQKQRIAIARALYKDPDILVLDEATSALDDETEAKIMDEIYEIAKDKTLIIIAHRLSTIRKCNKVYRLDCGRIKDVS